MARTQSPDFEQRRLAIVEKAAELFASLGFRGASVSDLARACDTSKSLIYHYYPSKEDVLYAVMLSHIDQLVEDVEAVKAEGGEPRDMLQRLLRRFMADYVGAANRQKVLLNELNSLPEDKKQSIVDKQRVIIGMVRDLIVAIHPEFTDRPAAAHARTMLMFGMINWTKTWFDPVGPLSADEIADMAFEMTV